jgi:putative pyrroloquinoline-quinone binding quinoprotein
VVGVRQQRGRTIAGRPRRGSARRHFARLLSRLRRRARRGVLGRIRLGTAGKSPRLRRWVLAAALLGVALVPYPVQGASGVPPATACRSGCRAGVTSMVRWTTPLSGAWNVAPGLAGTVPADGLAYAAVGGGLAAVGAGLTVTAYSSRTGALEWQDTLTGFPAGAAIVSVRAWPGEVTAGVSYRPAGGDQHGGAARRAEVVLSDADGAQSGRYPAATFGGAVVASQKYTVVVGATAVTSYDNTTGHVRWRRPTGPVAQAWRTDGNRLYLAESPGGFVDSAPASALHRIDLATGSEVIVRPIEGLSFPGTLSGAFDGVVLFSSAAGVTAYNGSTGARLWSAHGAVPEGIDHSPRRIYLTEGSNLVGVDPQTGKVKATASGSAVNGAAGVYVVRNGAALGLDQGASGGAWGYALAVQRVTRAAPGLPWPHYFVDLSGVGGSAGQAGNLVVIAACRQLAPLLPVQPSTSAPPSGPPPSGPPPSGPPPSGSPPSGPPSSGTATSPTSSSPPNTSTPPDASPSATAGTREPVQGCMRPELIALNL